MPSSTVSGVARYRTGRWMQGVSRASSLFDGFTGATRTVSRTSSPWERRAGTAATDRPCWRRTLCALFMLTARRTKRTVCSWTRRHPPRSPEGQATKAVPRSHAHCTAQGKPTTYRATG